MKPWILDRLLWIAAVGAVVMTIGQLALGSKPFRQNEKALPEMAAVLTYNPRQLIEAADSVASTDPFRLDRRPSHAPPGSPAIPSPSMPVSDQLHLALTGVSGGPPWHAIVSGAPGHDGGVVVKAGDTLGSIKVRTIRRDTVILQTSDSTLTLTLKR
jgi:hypothetical protein